MPWNITSLVTSSISGAVRLTGTTNANRLEYLIQAAPGSVPVLATPATGREIVTPGSPFSIDVAVANGDWRVDARAVAVDMLGLPQILDQPEDTAVVVGQSAAFTAEASSQLDDLTWGWQESANGTTWSSVTGANGSGGAATLVLTTAIADHSKQYRAVFTNTNGSRATFPAFLDVVDSPIVGSARINGLTGTQAVDEGSNAVFSWVHTGDGSSNFDYQWQKSIASVWTDIHGATSLEFALTGLETNDAGNYRIGVSFDNQLLTHFTIELTVTATVSLPVIATQPTNQSVTVGDPVTFTAAATGADTWLWQVSTDGSSWSAVSGATGSGNSATLTSTPVLDDDGLLYRAEFTNTAGATNTTGASLTVSSVAVLGDVRFGDLTPAGEGEQEIAAADGTYSVGGGSFTVAANRINVVTMPAVGTYAVDGVDVEVVAAARTCSTTAEIAYLWRRTAAYHPVGTKILIAPGTYNLFPALSGGFGTYLLNDWDWESLDADNRAVISVTANVIAAYTPSTGSPGFTFRRVNFFRPQDPIGLPWNPVVCVAFRVQNGVTNVEFNDCRFYGDFIPATAGGKLTTKSIGLSVALGSAAIITNCEIDHLCTGVQFSGDIDFQNNVIHDIYSDFIEGGVGLGGTIKNNHCYNKIGDGSFLHADWFQLFAPPNDPQIAPLLYEGNTHAPGPFWNLAAGQAHHSKPNAQIAVAGPTTLNIVDHHGCRQLGVRAADAGGTMTIVLPKASEIGKDVTYVPYQAGAGVVTIEKHADDTVDDLLTMTGNNQSRSFVSDGISHWSRVRPGYRGVTQIRNEDKTLGALELGLSVFSDDSLGNRIFTLPPGTDYFICSVKKDSTSAFTTTIRVPSGYTAIDHGITHTGPYDFVIARNGEVMDFERLGGETVWRVTEKTTTSQGFFAGPTSGYDTLTVRYNIFLVNSVAGFRLAEHTHIVNSKCHNNTFLRVAPPDANGDGFIAESDSWSSGAVGSIFVGSGLDTFRNAMTGNINDDNAGIDDVGEKHLIRHTANQSFGWNNPADLTALNVFLAASVPSDLRPTTRAETVAAAIVQTGGPLVVDAVSHSFIGAVGTTAANGPYNWDTGTANANTKLPLLTSMLPADGATAVPTNTTIRLNFDELVTLGTGNISIRTVGGAEIEAFNVATSDRIAFSGNGVTLVITPTAELPADANVCIRIDATAIDGYFNSFAGITDDSLDFTTGTESLATELLPDPGFDDTAQWAKGAGWTVDGGLAIKAGGTGNFSAVGTIDPEPLVTPGVTYQVTATVGTITTAAGQFRAQMTFFDAATGGTQISQFNSAPLLSTLTAGSVVSRTATAPAGAVRVRISLVATDGTAVFTASDISFQVV